MLKCQGSMQLILNIILIFNRNENYKKKVENYPICFVACSKIFIFLIIHFVWIVFSENTCYR